MCTFNPVEAPSRSKEPAVNDGNVLVVGSAHLDVLADYRSSNVGNVHHTGEVKHAVGGTGYNIAVDLAQAYIRTSLLSVVKEGSFVAVWIRTRLKEAGVNLEFLQSSDRVLEGGFIAIREDKGEGKVLKIGVTAAGIESVTFLRGVLEEAVEDCSLVVAECNLSVNQLRRVVETANRHERPILVGGVSECKAHRILELNERSRIDVFSLNEEEFSTIEEKPVDDLARVDVVRVCGRVRARYVVVTRGARGYTVLAETGQKQDFDAPWVEVCVSSSGAGDALLAGVAAAWLAERRFDWGKAHGVIKNYVSRGNYSACRRETSGSPAKTPSSADSTFSPCFLIVEM